MGWDFYRRERSLKYAMMNSHIYSVHSPGAFLSGRSPLGCLHATVGSEEPEGGSSPQRVPADGVMITHHPIACDGILGPKKSKACQSTATVVFRLVVVSHNSPNIVLYFRSALCFNAEPLMYCILLMFFFSPDCFPLCGAEQGFFLSK